MNIALVCNGIPKLGVIYAPAKKGNLSWNFWIGFYLNPHKYFSVDDIENYIIKILEKLPIDSQKSGYSVVVSGIALLSERTKTYIDNIKLNIDDVNLVSVGSSLKICMVAEGLADEYPDLDPRGMGYSSRSGHYRVTG